MDRHGLETDAAPGGWDPIRRKRSRIMPPNNDTLYSAAQMDLGKEPSFSTCPPLRTAIVSGSS
jgi:hypothetical protein